MFHLLKKPIKPLWYVCALLIVLLALLVQSARWLSPQLAQFKGSIEEILSEQLGARVSIETLSASWSGLSPEVVVSDLSIQSSSAQPLISIGQAQLQLDILASLFHWFPVWRDVQADNVDLTIIQTAEGGWTIGDLTTTRADDDWRYHNPGALFLLAHHVSLANAKVTLRFHNNRRLSMALPTVTINNSGYFHRLDAQADVDGKPVFHFIMEGVGNPAQVDQFFAKAYLKLDDFPLEPLAQIWTNNTDSFPELVVTDQGVDAQLWFDFAGPSRFYINGSLDWRVDASSAFAQQYYFDIPFNASVFGDYGIASGLTLHLSDIEIDQNMSIEAAKLVLHDDKLQVALPAVDLGQWHQWTKKRIHHGEQVQSLIDKLSPTGVLENVQLSLNLLEPEQSQLMANAHNVSTQAWHNIPAFSGVNGYVETRLLEGFAILESDNFSLWLQPLYPQPLQASAASGVINWTIFTEDKHIAISGTDLSMVGEYGQANGYFALQTTFKPQPGDTQLDLQIGLQNSPAAAHRQLVPTVLPQSLRDWLDEAIVDGHMNKGGLIYRGGFNDPLERSIQLFADAESATINFHREWPGLTDVTGELWIDNEFIRGRLDSATVYGDEKLKGSFSWSTRDNTVNIKGRAQAPVSSLLRYVEESWLSSLVGDLPQQWEGQGDSVSEIELVIPLEQSETPASQSVNVVLNNTEFVMTSTRLRLSDISGDIGYRSQTGFYSQQLRGNTLGGDFQATVSGGDALGPQFVLSATGRATAASVSNWLEQPVLSAYTKGAADYEAILQVLDDKQPPQLTIFSDLQGVSLDFPAPLKKEALLPVPLSLTMSFEPDITDYQLQLGNRLRVHHRSSENHQLALNISMSDSVAPILEALPSDGVKLVGHFDHLMAESWIDFLREQKTPSSSGSINKMDVFVAADQLHYGQNTVKNWILSGQREQQGWSFVVDSDDMLGGLYIDDDPERPWQVELDYVNWPPGGNQPVAEDISDSDIWSHLQPQHIPDMRVTINRLVYDEKPLGRWSFLLRSDQGGLELQNLYASVGGFSLSGNTGNEGALFRWQKPMNGGVGKTQFAAVISGGNLKTLIEQWQLPAVLESNSSRVQLDLEWLGSPMDFAIERLQGNLSLAFNDGVFSQDKVKDAAGVLRLLGLLNFDSWLRRVRLDFSDVYKNGIVFDEFYGTLQFNDGVVDFTDPLNMKGPSSKMRLSGSVDYGASTVDATLTATLPVGGNLTMVTALAAGLPAAAGVYIVTKLLGKQIDKASSITYLISGDLKDPQVDVQKVEGDQVSQVEPTSEQQ